jgi:uncharacterized membrane protein YesL
MSRSIFHPDSGLMITFGQITDCIFLSLFWLLGCIPVVTIGASFAALYDAAFRGMRRNEKNSWQRFLTVYKENWKGGIAPTLVFLPLLWLLVRLTVGLWNGAVFGQISWGVFAAGAFFSVLALGILSILFPMLSRFENPLAAQLKNTVLIGFANLPGTIALGLVNGLTALLCVRYVVPLFFLPALAALIGSLFIEPMFRPYMPKEEDAA